MKDLSKLLNPPVVTGITMIDQDILNEDGSKVTSTLKTEEIKVRITPSLRRQIDEVRGEESVSSLVRGALYRYFSEIDRPATRDRGD